MQPSSVKLVPEAQVPSFETLDTQPLYGASDLFPNHPPAYIGSEFPQFDRNSYPRENTTLHRLIRGVGALRSQTIAQEGQVPVEETEKMLIAANLQESLIQGINGAMTRMTIKGFSVLEATYALDDYINRRDQEMHDRYSAIVADDARLFYAMRNGGELRLPGPVEEMILDPESEMKQLEGSVAQNICSMERLRFEWLSASVIVEAVRQDARSGADDLNRLLPRN